MVSSESGASAHDEEPNMLPVDDDKSNNAKPVFYRPPYIREYTIDDIPTCRPPPSVPRSAIAESSSARGHATARSPCCRPRPSVLLFDDAADYPVTVIDAASGALRLALRRSHGKPPMDGCTLQNCCGALVCLRTRLGGAELLNPVTGECLHLGLQQVRATGSRHHDHHDDEDYYCSSWYCLGRCPSTGEYKLMLLYYQDCCRSVVCEVLALRQGGDIAGRQWQQVGVWDARHWPAGRGVHIGGVVYYLTDRKSFIVCFDLSTYQVRRIKLPETLYTVASPALCELDGQLCVTVVCGRPSTRAELYPKMILHVCVLDGGGGGGGEAWFFRYYIELNHKMARRKEIVYAPTPLLLRGGKLLVKCAVDESLYYYGMAAECGRDGARMVREDVVHKQHNGGEPVARCVTADVFVESFLPLRDILRA